MAEALVLINAFEVPVAEAERFIAAWEKTRDYLMPQPGYVDTALHQAVTPNAEFQFVNIGRWQTAEDFLAATQSPGFREAAVKSLASCKSVAWLIMRRRACVGWSWWCRLWAAGRSRDRRVAA